MALFPILENDDKVQIGEKIRFYGGRSFVSKGSTAISTMTVVPEADISAVDVYDAVTDNRYLDWVFNDFEIDIDATNNKINFNESGSELTATISTATYSLSALASEIKTQLDSAGALTYTVSYGINDKITISATGSFELMPTTGSNRNNSLLPIICFRPRGLSSENKVVELVDSINNSGQAWLSAGDETLLGLPSPLAGGEKQPDAVHCG